MKVTVTHNLAAQIREVVEDEMTRAGGTYVAGIIAMNVVERLRQEDPGLLAKYLEQHAVQVVREMVLSINRVTRHRARAMSGKTKSVFADALDRYEQGQEQALSPWLDTVYVVTTEFQRKELRDMDKEDLEFAANQYTARARINAAQAAFLRALAGRVGALTVGEVFTDDELSTMWQSLAS